MNILNNKISIKDFFLLKELPDNKILDDLIFKKIKEILDNTTYKEVRKKKNIINKPKFINKKDNTINKVSTILNKLSDTNIHNIVLEFIETMGQVSEDIFNEILMAIYIKIINEINFINTYIIFLKIIYIIYNEVQKYKLNFFIDIIQSKFELDYTHKIINNDLINFVLSSGENTLYQKEQNRINNLKLIVSMVNTELLLPDIIEICHNILLDQNMYLTDIYYWYKLKKSYKLSEDEIILLNKKIESSSIAEREKILINSIISYSI
jgi:hypothetical protein